MDRHLQRVCLNLGIAFPVVFFAGWGLIAGFLLPMPAPHDTAEQVVAFFSHDSLRIGIGLIIAVAAAPLQGAMAAVVGVYLRRSAGANSALAYTQMLMGGVQVIFALVPCIMWAALAFRAGAHDALLFVPGGICLIAQRGPFAWNGILAFWIPATVFGGWFFVMYFALRRAIEADDGAEVADLQPAA